ncbi:MAG: thiamine-phosphate kinase [Pseudomonadota bacterium]|nr:thiamine-phosphate kinase [Pseudomonadota bacterium]
MTKSAVGTSDGRLPGEFELIERHFVPLASSSQGALKLLDDAALYSPRSGEELVLTADTIVEGVHFRPADRPGDIGYKGLAVNVSDLVAKGATPAGYLLCLSIGSGTGEKWVAGLAKGLREAQDTFGCQLLGGDTTATPGPSTIAITAVGRVKRGGMLLRSGARSGDQVYVSGTIGDAAAGLVVGDHRATVKLPRASRSFLAARYLRPRPRIELLAALRSCASAAMDISDGLVGDFAKMCAASKVGGTLTLSSLPLSPAARTALAQGIVSMESLVTGGDDYEILAAVPPRKCAAFERAAAKAGSPVVRMGAIAARSEGVSVLGPDDAPMTFASAGYAHF